MRSCSQGAGAIRDQVAAGMGISREKLRVITEDVGGAFGMKTTVYPEYPALLVAARKLGRPVHWMSTRSEAFVTDTQARDTVTDAELALDDKGKFLALRIRHLGSMGAFLGSLGAHIQTNNFSRCFPGMYRIPQVGVGVQCVFTNTMPTGPYRGAGRPEANYVLERVVDEAARMLKIDRAELRRRNLIPASRHALQDGGRHDLRQRRSSRRSSTRRSTSPATPTSARAGSRPPRQASRHRHFLLPRTFRRLADRRRPLAFPGGRSLTVGLGLHSTGQSHATVFARLVAERLGIPAAEVRVAQGDTKDGVSGFASVASRSATTVRHSLVVVIDKMLAKGRSVASGLLEAAEGDIAYRNGTFEVVGTDRRISLFEVAKRAARLAARGVIPEALDTKTTAGHAADLSQRLPRRRGRDRSRHRRHDHRRLHGGRRLRHRARPHDRRGPGARRARAGPRPGADGERRLRRRGGQLVTGSFMDYAMPRADDMPPIRDALHPVPATTNPLGVKGVGEAGTTGSLAAIMNAIADAIPGGAA